MKNILLSTALSLATIGLLQADVVFAGQAESAQAAAAKAAEQARIEAEQAAAGYGQVVEQAEQMRVEAERARREAQRISEHARETAQREAEAAREEAERSSSRSEEATRARAAREQEMARAREELSRAHRELREAQREIALAHRELARSEAYRVTTSVINLGDRPVIGVVLGETTEKGVELIGVSPDGPAEAAGIEVGDVMVAIADMQLAGRGKEAKPAIFEVMETTRAGDSIEIEVVRDGQPLSFAVVADVREPASWQSMVRLPEIMTIESTEGGPGEQRIVVESMVVPDIDDEALAERMEELKEKLASTEYRFHAGRFPHDVHSDIEFEFEDFSDVAGHAFSSADVWFGMPQAQGLELATINEGLGAYFKTDRGVLVVKARDGNAYELESGDVILAVGGSEVSSPSDLVRALRETEPGEAIEIEIKRDRRNKTLTVTMPENRFGFR